MIEKILNNTTPYGKIRASPEGSLHSSTLTSHRHHLETAPPFTVPCEGRKARFLHREPNSGPSITHRQLRRGCRVVARATTFWLEIFNSV